MTNQIAFVSVDEQALETVTGGLLDIANFSGNNNCINVLSGIVASVGVGDVLSNILNIANEVG
jgi:putative heme degradation protein